MNIIEDATAKPSNMATGKPKKPAVKPGDVNRVIPGYRKPRETCRDRHSDRLSPHVRTMTF